jgi:hypothetical protein
MQIKTMTFYLIPGRIATTKNQKLTNAGKYVRKREPLYIVGGNVSAAVM